MATRLIRLEDAPLLAELLALNREFLAPWEPTRPDEQFTADGQRRQIEDALERHAADAVVPHVILEHGSIVGRVTLSNVVGGPFQSCNLGYWATFRRPGPSSIVSVADERFRPDADSGAAAGEPTVLRAGRWGFA